MSKFNQAKYIQEYQKEKYDRCIFNLPKGEKERLKQHYTKQGYTSLNQYINNLIQKDMNDERQSVNIGKINQKGKHNTINIGE